VSVNFSHGPQPEAHRDRDAVPRTWYKQRCLIVTEATFVWQIVNAPAIGVIKAGGLETQTVGTIVHESAPKAVVALAVR
jgi:hypothetical protein